VASEPKSQRCTLPYVVASKQVTKGEWIQPNKQEGPKDQQAQTHKRKANKHGSKGKGMEKSKQSTKMQKITNPNPLFKLGCMDVGLDH